MEIQNETQIEKPDIPRIVMFSADKDECWSLFPDMLRRIGRFTQKYCPDTVPEFLIQSVKEDFSKPNPAFLVVGAIDDDWLIGHMLACVSIPPWSQKRRCLVLQYEIDEEKEIPVNLLRAALDVVGEWSKVQYCSTIIAEVKTEQTRRIFGIVYGFRTDMIQVEKDV